MKTLILLAGISLASSTTTGMSANPVRRVVSMLQMMQKKVTEEGKKEQELFDKFMCYCKTGAGTLTKSIDEATTKIPQLESDLKSGNAQRTQFAADIVQAKTDKEAAKTTMAEATAIRNKAAQDFAKETAEQKADAAAMGKAINAIAKGQAGFLQTPAATVLRRLALSTDLSIESRDTLTSFLSQGSSSSEDEDSYAPGSGEITGILKQMKETMEKDVADSSADEAGSIKDYDALMAAKAKESEALTKEVEVKIARVGETGVQLANGAEDLDQTEKSLTEDTKFLANLDKTCKTKTDEWDLRQKTRGEELTALADTIKLLNDDAALDLFKKTLPSASFLQIQVTAKEVQKQALQALRSSGLRIRDYRLDLISMAMKGKNVNFGQVLGMIDDMVGLLKKEQVDDDKKKAYCAKAFDKAEDDKKELARSEDDLNKAIADEKEVIATSAEEIASLEDGIKALDKSVADATSNRKNENAEFSETLAANNAAVEIIGIAKNRMNKFYNPKLHKEAPAAAPALIEEAEAPEFVQVSAHLHQPAPPAGVAGAYKKKSGESGGVIAMMDTLINEVKKEVEEMKFDEKEAQADYEKFMSDSSTKRAADAKSVAEKEAARADTASKLQKHGEELKATLAEMMANGELEMNLHGECDWLVQNFDVRKSARAGEADSLTKAKAVLSGADE